jgi:para-aminobenzoate synthetase / 4-amino-4-deoxychorismate lyase
VTLRAALLGDRRMVGEIFTMKVRSESGLNQWTQLPAWLHSVVAQNSNSVLLQTSRFDEFNKRSLLFANALRTITAVNLKEIPGLFRQIEEALASGLHVAGYVGYECGYHFEHFDGIAATQSNLPLAWFGVYRAPATYDHARGQLEGESDLPVAEQACEDTPERFAEYVGLAIAKDDYCAKIQEIKRYIAAGETYQVNFTDKVCVATTLSPDQAFGVLLQQQPVAYGAFLNVADHHILSFSPELFFRIDGDTIVTRPMKGTMSRGLDVAEDAEAALRLQRDEKNRSEHVMIVDLLRNDLGRICTMGSVQVEDIFSVEKYETLLQMTSTVSGTLRHGLSYYEIFKAMFPSGSITGAPKIRTMQIIHEIEHRTRGVYTGAIGYISPNGSSTFNVAIRTLILKDGEARMGVGGGIVADSEPSEEYRECLLKAQFLVRPRRDFQLIETMLWDGDYTFLAMHMDRLESSAEYFSFSCERAAVTAQLMDSANLFQPEHRYRVRLLLSATGSVTLSTTQLTLDSPTGSVRLSPERTFSGDVFFRHKTTQRKLYERQYAEAQANGFDDTIFLNEREEITEGTISNIFVRRGGRLLTPPLSSGVLPGVFRRHLLEIDAEEQVMKLADLESADAVFLCNSVRGLWRVKLRDG